MKKGHIVLNAVGDIMLGDHPVCLGHGVRSKIEKRGAEHLFAKIKGHLAGADIIFGNLEVILSDKGLNRKSLSSFEFRGSPNAIPALKNAGFKVLSVANNHAMEHGIEAFRETVTLLERSQMSCVGITDDSGLSIPFILDKDGVKLVLVAYSLRQDNYFKAKVPYALTKREHTLEEIRSLRDHGDVLVVSLHWGEEFLNSPSPSQIAMAHELVDNGVDLILGHHPHVLQGIEKYNGAVIVYSLGNFVFDMWQEYARETMILKAEFSKSGIENFQIIPLYINKDFQIEVLNNERGKRLVNKVKLLSKKIHESHLHNNLDIQEAQYSKLAYKAAMKHRLENYSYFLSRIFRYSPSIVIQSLARALVRRFED